MTGPRADASGDERSVSAVVIRRMRELRKSRDYSAERLAAEMVRLGVPWTRDVVANLENGRRENITVDELAALALALRVSPVDLLWDSDSRESQLTPRVRQSSVLAKAWWTGEGPRRFLARARIAELVALGGQAIHRQLAEMDRRDVEDIALEALGVFAVLDDRPGAACRFWRRYAETGKTR